MLAAPVWWYRLSSPTPEGIGYSQFRARRGGVAVGIDASSGLALQFSDQSVFKCLQSCGASIGRTANFSRLRNRSSIAPIDEPQQQPCRDADRPTGHERHDCSKPSGNLFRPKDLKNHLLDNKRPAASGFFARSF
jgi:hypothetical protein